MEETGKQVYNGYNEIYVNTKTDDNSEISELMKIFISSEITNNEKFPEVCESIRTLKEENSSGVMCEVVEEYAREKRLEGKIEGELSLMTVILELKKGVAEEELIERGYEESTIKNAKLVLF